MPTGGRCAYGYKKKTGEAHEVREKRARRGLDEKAFRKKLLRRGQSKKMLARRLQIRKGGAEDEGRRKKQPGGNNGRTKKQVRGKSQAWTRLAFASREGRGGAINREICRIVQRRRCGFGVGRVAEEGNAFEAERGEGGARCRGRRRGEFARMSPQDDVR